MYSHLRHVSAHAALLFQIVKFENVCDHRLNSKMFVVTDSLNHTLLRVGRYKTLLTTGAEKNIIILFRRRRQFRHGYRKR